MNDWEQNCKGEKYIVLGCWKVLRMGIEPQKNGIKRDEKGMLGNEKRTQLVVVGLFGVEKGKL